MKSTVRPVCLFSVMLLMRFISCSTVAAAPTPPEEIRLKDYRPHSIFKIPETRVEKARYPVIDVHSHNYAPTDADIEQEVAYTEERILLANQRWLAALEAERPPVVPRAEESDQFSADVRERIAAARQRTASSSCATGAPNSAMTSSPMNLSTVPP